MFPDGDPESVFGAAVHDMQGNGPNPPWQDLVAGLAG